MSKKSEKSEAVVKVAAAALKAGDSLRNFMEKHRSQEQELINRYGPGFDKPSSSFSINKAEQQCVNEWFEKLKPEIIKKTGKLSATDPLGIEEPYYGAIGGGLTYSFLPTGLGSILTVKESITGKELNVTEALDWFFFG